MYNMLVFFFFRDLYCRIVDLPEAQQALEQEQQILLRIEQMRHDKLWQWKKEVTNIIHLATSNFLLKTTETHLLATNFDDNVSIYHQFSMGRHFLCKFFGFFFFGC